MRQRQVLVSIERELRTIYDTKNSLFTPIDSSQKQELADLLQDIKITEIWREEATGKFLQYHREIQEYKARNL